jgi:hypothetical protein
MIDERGARLKHCTAHGSSSGTASVGGAKAVVEVRKKQRKQRL